MRILHFSTYDMVGGAAKAAYRQHRALRNAGCFSRMIVRYKQSRDKDVLQVGSVFSLRSIARRIKRRVPFLRELSRYMLVFDFDRNPNIDTSLFYDEKQGNIDILSLHWITGLLTVKTIRQLYVHYRCPIVWTLSDIQPITGGCHYSFDCKGFREQCGNCPQLNGCHPEDRSRIIWKTKYNYLRDLPITFIAHSSWLVKRVRESSLFKEHEVKVIPLAIDTEIFRPFDRRLARKMLGVPQDKKIIFFGACSLADPRKGMRYLKEALQVLASISIEKQSQLNIGDVFLLVVGAEHKEILDYLPFPCKKLGLVRNDAELALAFGAADVFVSPSVEEAGSMMIPEAMLCGTPVVAFNRGGAPDLIETMKTGYLTKNRDSFDLAKGIYALLTADNLSSIGVAAYDAAMKRHSPPSVAVQYIELCKRAKD